MNFLTQDEMQEFYMGENAGFYLFFTLFFANIEFIFAIRDPTLS